MWAAKAPCLWPAEDCESREEGQRTDWFGTRTFDEAYRLALYGWPEGAAMMRRAMPMESRGGQVVITSRPTYDVAGDYPDVGRAVTGDMFSMATPFRRSAQRVRDGVTLRYSFGGIAKVETSRMTCFGVALLSFIDELELGGTPVTLNVLHESVSSGPDVSFRFPLKRAGESVSLAGLAFWLAHPSAFRRIAFSAMERLDIYRWFGDGYGSTCVVTPPPPGVLAFDITDASDDVAYDLRTIRDRYRTVVTNAPRP
jgi:hypothetical protein